MFLVPPRVVCTEIGGGGVAALTPNFLSEWRLKVSDLQLDLRVTRHVGHTRTVPVSTVNKRNPHFLPPIIQQVKM